MHDGFRPALVAVLALIGLGAVAMALNLSARLPVGLWLEALLAPSADDIRELLVHYSVAPRAVVALIAGAGLALAGAVLQQALRNPLASPSTLGVSAGAQLALSLATVAAPSALLAGREVVALLGGAASTAVVTALSWRSRFAPLTVILSGMVAAMFCGAAASALTLFNERMLTGLYVWGSGALNQQDWSVAGPLGVKVAVLAGLVALTVRPLQLLEMDEPARSLGLSVVRLRLVTIGLAVALTAVIVSAVGVIGFIGLAAPALARALGVRRLRDRLAWSAAIGAAILFATDALLQAAEALAHLNVPTGAATALIGAPTLVWLASRLRNPAPVETERPAGPRVRRVGLAICLLATAVPVALLASLAIGPAPGGGLSVAPWPELAELLPWRWPRTLGAGAAGAMLAAAGLMLQRLTRNPIASPEVLGVSSGAALGFVLALLFAPSPGLAVQTAAAAAGGFLVAGALLGLGRGGRLAPEQLLIAGVALGAMFSALLAILMASGDPRMLLVANWMAGSTYDVEPAVAVGTMACAIVQIAASFLVVRWLDLAPLGRPFMLSVGASPAVAGLGVLALCATLTAGATLAVGPLSFAGLIAPHLALRLGFARAGGQLAAAALIGALTMIAADWLGRVVYVPFQVPAGLIGMLIAGPLLMWLLQRR
ncbi:Fe(3+)-hydroxamate ABC transporter permease FhuB [Chenggangzhangella methanolivorans]|uniref:Fe(3+)-hydroxamate ABC transporter permease FhuB n=1 Tax=Chenggangzhangella methanolivorans TaxID=1437009 RepID=A0A9E6RD35_9HYPH|nr:Fe(3+)-hydroxamate ABC transporter permease FhuB [Chenggangzhangella methanolivorans]QZN98835.1 Fe(3+)-hydroxamate ABC transporter permease FhuB [Chenggangzhangella methanolivorans]